MVVLADGLYYTIEIQRTEGVVHLDTILVGDKRRQLQSTYSQSHSLALELIIHSKRSMCVAHLLLVIDS